MFARRLCLHDVGDDDAAADVREREGRDAAGARSWAGDQHGGHMDPVSFVPPCQHAGPRRRPKTRGTGDSSRNKDAAQSVPAASHPALTVTINTRTFGEAAPAPWRAKLIYPDMARRMAWVARQWITELLSFESRHPCA